MAKITYQYWLENIHNNPKYTKKAQYAGYLGTEVWDSFRDHQLEEFPYCAMCGKPATQVHHPPALYPEVFGEEDPKHLTSLCDFCHSNFHNPPTLEEYAKQVEVDRKHKKGTTCKCCKQKVHESSRKINSGMARVLIEAYKIHKEGDFEDGWFKLYQSVKTKISSAAHDWSLFKHWGILEEKINEDTNKKTSGVWRFTDKGVSFVKGEISVPKCVITFNGECMGFEGEMVKIADCLDKHFDYRELMGYDA